MPQYECVDAYPANMYIKPKADLTQQPEVFFSEWTSKGRINGNYTGDIKCTGTAVSRNACLEVTFTTITSVDWWGQSGDKVDWQGIAYSEFVTEYKVKDGDKLTCQAGVQVIDKEGNTAFCCNTQSLASG
jgi:hypothetical protein